MHRNSQGHMSARSSEFRTSSVEEDCGSVTLDPAGARVDDVHGRRRVGQSAAAARA